MWSDFHIHSPYCDGKGSLPDYVSKARSLGLDGIGFSSHAPLPFAWSWCLSNDRFPVYLNEIEAVRSGSSGLNIYKGLDVDYVPDKISPTDFSPLLDYTISSIHFVDSYADGRCWEIDGPHLTFLDGLKAIFLNDIRAVISRYYELTREMILDASPSIVGHLDKIKIQNIANKFFRETDSWYQKKVKQTIAAIARAGVIVEGNTRELYQQKSGTTYPSPLVLELFRDKKIPITLSSDAHHLDDIINLFSETATLLGKLGFKKINVLTDGGWKPFDFDENGISGS